ncbi:MAG: hypothetical protein MZW92_21715 [Comamonadaceae bacterium]|nr:hypothetical protein [Comamonadaceae bacterium]
MVTIGALLGMAAHLEGKGCVGARHGRPRAEGRRGVLARAASPHAPERLYATRIAPARPTWCSAATWWRRPATRRCRRCARGRTPRGGQHAPRSPTARLRPQPRPRPPAQPAHAGADRARRSAPSDADVRRRHRARHRAARRRDRHQPVHARLRLAARAASRSSARRIDARDRAERRGGRGQPGAPSRGAAAPRTTSTAVGAARRRHGGARRTGSRAPTLDEIVAPPRRVPDRLPGRRLRAALRRALVERVRAGRVATGVPGSTGSPRRWRATTSSCWPIKDEYEVARLHADADFRDAASRAQFEGDYKLAFHLAPPLLAKRRSRHRRADEDALRPVDADRVRALLAKLRAPARHRARRLRPHRRAAHRARADRRVREAGRRTARPARRRQSRRGRRAGRASRRRSAATATSRRSTWRRRAPGRRNCSPASAARATRR